MKPISFSGLSEAAKAAEMERRASRRGRVPEKDMGFILLSDDFFADIFL